MSHKTLLALLFAVGAATLNPLYADEGKKQFSEKQLAQQQRMKDCSAQAKEKGLKGEDRKAHMKDCLSGGAAVPEPKKAAKK